MVWMKVTEFATERRTSWLETNSTRKNATMVLIAVSSETATFHWKLTDSEILGFNDLIRL